MNQSSYYNTTGLSGQQLEQATAAAKTQEAGILSLFQSQPTVKASASQIHAGGIKHQLWTSATPLTSIRRALTDLTKQGKLIKLDETRKGVYGKPEFYFALVTK